MAIRSIAQILAAVNAIRNETTPGANSRARVSDALQDIADTGINRSLKQVANVTALRADATLIEFGHVYLACHTVAGWGGGDLYWDTVSTAADDGGTVFAVTGVTTGRWRRRYATSQALLTDFGADPTGAASSDAAWEAANTWRLSDPTHRSIRIPDGRFWLSATHTMSGLNVTIVGNGQSSVLYFTGGTSTDLFNFSGLIKHLVMRNFKIAGPASCGRAAMALTSGATNWLEYYVDLVITGGWTYWVHATGSVASGRGAFQWGSLRLTNLQDGDPPYAYPVNGVYVEGGYFNVCKLYVDAYMLSGDAIHIEQMAEYLEGNYAFEISGSAQSCNRGLYIWHGLGTTIHDWAEESNTLPSRIELNDHIEIRQSFINSLSLVGVTNSTFSHVHGTISTDSACAGNAFVECGVGVSSPVLRANMADVFIGGGKITGVAGPNTGGYGYQDPPNWCLNGDFSRYIDGAATTNLWGWGGYGESYVAVKCGEGCVDTTHPRDSKFCALVDRPGNTWTMATTLTPPLDASYLGCDVVVTLKYRPVVAGTGLLMRITQVGEYATMVGNYGGEVEADDDWHKMTIRERVTAGMCATGISFLIYGPSGSRYYLAEVTFTIGRYGPRTFKRCERSPFYACDLTEYGGLIVSAEDAPVAATDPIKGEVWQDGDLVVNTDRLVETTSGGTSFVTCSWDRIGGAWVPLQMITGLVGVP